MRFCDAAYKFVKAKHTFSVSTSDGLAGFLLEDIQVAVESLETAKIKLQKILKAVVRADINNIPILLDCVNCIDAIDKMVHRLVRTAAVFASHAPRNAVESRAEYLKRIFSNMPFPIAVKLSSWRNLTPFPVTERWDGISNAIAATVKTGYTPLMELSMAINELDSYGFLESVLDAFVSDAASPEGVIRAMNF